MEQKKVSIIVPVYNVEKYLEKNINSLINQTLEDIELIFVNDGSPDNSLKIIKDYQEKYKDKNIIIVDKQNEGVWKARIDGIEKASGKYITFVDSDDYVEPDFAKKMYNNISENKSDIAICGFRRIDTNSGKILSEEMKYKNDKQINNNDNFEEVISVNTALWNKIYKAELLKKMNNLSNPPRILEDMMFLAMNYLNVKKITFVDDCLYNYIVRDGSAMNVLKKEEIKKIQNSMLEVKKYYIDNNCSSQQMEILSSIAFLHFGVSLMIKASNPNNCDFKEEYKNNLLYLNENFIEWKKTKYLNIFYSLTHKRANFKIAIIKKIYRLHMFKMFVSFYKFIINTLKIEIKW